MDGFLKEKDFKENFRILFGHGVLSLLKKKQKILCRKDWQLNLTNRVK